MEKTLAYIVIFHWILKHSFSLIIPHQSSKGETECKTDLFGNRYTGTLNHTAYGNQCLHWSFNNSIIGNFSWMGDHNYCRNPDMSGTGPWCFVMTNDQTVKEPCRVPLCAGIPYENRTECHGINCENGGILEVTYCSCSCPSGYSGLFCEIELKDSGWPDGSYAMLASMFGCPELPEYGWTTGFVNLTADKSYKNFIWNDDDVFSFEPHILGPYSSHNLQLNFCIKTKKATSIRRASHVWPEGDYCIYKVDEECPKGFQEGNLTIREYSMEFGGDLVVTLTNESSAATAAILGYCCREDGADDKPIKLRSDFPFILLPGPSSSSCQPVEGMESTLDIFYITIPPGGFGLDGVYPNFTTTINLGHLGMEFCYYQSLERRECKYEVDNGASYKGRLNVTKSGRQCAMWTDVGTFTTDTRWVGEFEHNYCRSAWWKTAPGCQLSENEWELCDIPECDDNDYEGFNVYGEGLIYNGPETIDGTFAANAVDGKFGPDATAVFGRLYEKPWFLVDLQEDIEVHAIVLYRNRVYFPVNHRYLGTYVSNQRWDFLDHGAIRCDDIRNPRWNTIFRYQCKRPITGQFVSVRNFDFPDNHRHGYFHYFELEEIQVLGRRTMCGRRLGMVTGDIYDYQIEASSSKSNTLTPPYGRLFSAGEGWCAAENDQNPWLMVDMIVPVKIQGVELQGIKRGQSVVLINSFRVLYGVDRNRLQYYEYPKGYWKTYKTNTDMGVSVQMFRFDRDILARFIKIELIEYTDPCLKMELIGCPVRVTRDLFCKEEKYDFGYEVLPHYVFWMDETENLEKMLVPTNDNIECLERCEDINCLTFTYSEDKKDCFMHYGHPYTPAFRDWLVGGFDPDRINYQRLCFKEFSNFGECTHFINLTKNGVTTIQSPSFPLHFGNGVKCSWHIQSNNYVEIEIISILLPKAVTSSDMQRLGIFDVNPGSCEDQLELWSFKDQKLITPTSTIHNGQKILSGANTVVLHLSSCFQLYKYTDQSFEIKAKDSDLPGCGTFGTCFKTCSYNAAYIMTPGFPVSYQNDDACFWKIEGGYGQYIIFQFLSLDVIDDSSCEKANVILSDVDLRENANRIGKFCKENIPMKPIISSWHKLHVEFRASRDLPTGGGFKGKYKMESFIQKSFDDIVNTCEENWHRFGGSCYSVFKQSKLTWLDAESSCKSNGGHLVSIGNIEEMEFIHYLVTVVAKGFDDDSAYIGLTKKTNGHSVDDFIWSDESPMTYTAWFTSSDSQIPQPDGFQNEQCSIIKLFSIHDMNNWHDVACAYDGISNFICEKQVSLQVEYNIRESLHLSTDFNNDTTLYQCQSQELILREFLCDQIKDCMYGEDEHNCDEHCSGDQYTCKDGGCISISLHCDFIKHCRDGSDEVSCERANCSSTQWQCSNKQCIDLSKRCDFVTDCMDRSDELACDFCGPDSFQCYDQSCIPKSRICDGFIDCSGLFHEDEPDHCQQATQHTCADWWSLGMKTNGEYRIDLYSNETATVECNFEEKGDLLRVSTIIHHNSEHLLVYRDSLEFAPIYFAKEHHISTLKNISSCTQSLKIMCSYHWGIPHRETPDMDEIYFSTTADNCSCPFVGNCSNGNDRCNCDTIGADWYQADDNEIRSDYGMISNHSQIPVVKFWMQSLTQYFRAYIGPLICIQDVKVSSNVFRCQSGQIVSADDICRLDYDDRGEVTGCRDLSHLNGCQQYGCPNNYLKCSESFCIPPNLLCNGIKDCPHGEDEMHCDKPNCTGLYKCRESSICIDLTRRCDGTAQCPLFDDEFLCHSNCPENCECKGFQMKCALDTNGTLTFPVEARKLDLSYSSLRTSTLHLDENILLAELNLSSTSLQNVQSLYFGDTHNMYLLDLSFNEIEYIPKDSFKGLVHLTKLLLEGNHLIQSLFPYSFIGLESLPSLSIHRSRISKLQYKTFRGLENLDTLNISSNQITNVEDGTFDGLHKLKTLDMRKNRIAKFSGKIFLGLNSVEKIYSDAFVFCCLRPATVREEDCLPYKDEFSSCEDMMRNDMLRVCLWVIGLCALVGNCIVLCYRFIYDRSSLRKGHGIFISSLGIADLVMGVYMLMIASADAIFRGNYVWNDLAWRYGRLCKVAGVLSTFSSECSVMFLFMITIDRFFAIKYPFGQIRFDRKLSGNISLAIFIISICIAVAPLLPVSYFDGEFYSRSAVCLAMPLTRDKPKGWQYSFGIFIVFNFVLFLIIAGIQLVIYREIKSTSRTIRSTQKKNDLTIARSLFVVVFSDFLCWFPVGVMGLMAMADHPVPGDVYAWTAVFVLPINSALNPFLYTFSAIIRERRRESRKSSSAHTFLTALASNASAGKLYGENSPRDKLYYIVEKMMSDGSMKPGDLQHLIKKMDSLRGGMTADEKDFDQKEKSKYI